MYYKWSFISWGISLVGAIAFAMAICSDDFWGNPLTYVGVVVILMGVILGFLKCRCPHCGEYVLSGRAPLLEIKCPKCGKNLEG